MYIDFLSSIHKSTSRDYLARVNDPEFPKAIAADLAKNGVMIIGMVIEEFATGVINTFQGGGNQLLKL